MPSIDPVGHSLVSLVIAAIVMFGGIRLLWLGSPGAGLARGLLLGAPIIAIALLFTFNHSPSTAIALLLSSSVFVMTLGNGVAASNVMPGEGVGSPLLRLLAPLCLLTCLIGFHGSLTSIHAVALLVTAALTLWTAAERRGHVDFRSGIAWIAASVPLLVIGIVLIYRAVGQFQSAAGANVVTPIVVLMIGPAALIALLGVMSKRDPTGEGAPNTVVGFVIACLGVGQPLVIGISHALARFSTATTRPSTIVLMPVASWRVDSVLLVVLSMLFIPIGVGRFKLGRVEGFALVILYLVYARVAVHTGSLAG